MKIPDRAAAIGVRVLAIAFAAAPAAEGNAGA